MARVIDAGIGARTPGEQRALDVLKTLPKSWLIIANKMLPLGRDQSLEIDMIVVSEHRIFVIDEKSWGGSITGTDQYWQLRGSHMVPNPLNKVEHVVRQLASRLRADVPNFPQGGRVIGARVLLSNPTAKHQLRDPRAKDQVLTLDNVVDRLMKQDAAGTAEAFLTPHHAAIETVLFGMPARPEHPTHIDPYRIDELVKRLPGCRIYRATHPTGGERVLFVYDPPAPGAPPAEVERVHRETEILRSLQGSGVVPTIGDSLRWSEDYEVVPMHVPKGRPLGTLPPPTSPQDAIRDIRRAAAAFEALTRIHAAGIVHRAVGPDVVAVLDGEETGGAEPVIMVTGFMSARKADTTTIFGNLDAAGITDGYVAPEIAKLGSYGYAEPASDVYSLALVLLERLAGVSLARIVPDRTPGGQAMVPAASADDGSWPYLDAMTVDALRGQFAAALRAGPMGVANDPSQMRPGSADLATALRSIADAAHQRLQPDLDRLYDGKYRMIRELGAGASARTLLVENVELHEHYAAKLYFQPGALAEGGEALREYRLLWKYPHPNLPRPASAPSPKDDLPLLLEWIDGPTLRNALPQFVGDRKTWLALAYDLCAAVKHLEEHKLLHRDIKPENILIKDANGRAYLIDYGGSAEHAAPGAPAGTYRYLPPEWFSAEEHPETSDRYALAVTLYEALTGELPFIDQSAADRTPAPHPPASLPSELHSIAQVLLRNVAIAVEARHTTAEELIRAIDAAAARLQPEPDADTTGATNVVRQPLNNPWVTGLRGLFRNSAIGNADNRGLDSQFSWDTYIPTALDTRLGPAVQRERPAVVFLSGNPGDGKTAYLEQVRKRLEAEGGTISPSETNLSGWEVTLSDGHVVRACFDASEAADGKGADEQLAHRLRGLEGDSLPPKPGLTVYVAINDGRLGEVRNRFADQDFAGLIAETRAAMTRTEHPTDGMVWVVDLKQRSYVDPAQTETPSVMRTMLNTFTAPDQWSVCDGCSAIDVCPIRANARMLALPDQDGPAARLERLLALAHLRGERHMTVRDLRSGLALLITGDLGCTDVHAVLGEDGSPAPITGPRPDALDGPWAAAYWNTAFATPASRDLVLGEIQPLDPSRFPHPRLERFLYFRQRPDDAPARSALFAHGGDLPPGAEPDPWLAAAKRRLVFEGRRPDQADQPGGAYADEHGGFDIAGLLPYRHADRFIGALSRAIPAKELLADVLRGISCSDGLSASLPGTDLWLNVGGTTEHGIDILKQFPADKFSLEVAGGAEGNGPADGLVETVPRALELRHTDTSARVRLTLDLWETLAQLADGLDPASQELEPLLEELGPFKSQVKRSATKELILIERGGRNHRLSRSGDIIIRSNLDSLTAASHPDDQETTAP